MLRGRHYLNTLSNENDSKHPINLNYHNIFTSIPPNNDKENMSILQHKSTEQKIKPNKKEENNSFIQLSNGKMITKISHSLSSSSLSKNESSSLSKSILSSDSESSPNKDTNSVKTSFSKQRYIKQKNIELSRGSLKKKYTSYRKYNLNSTYKIRDKPTHFLLPPRKVNDEKYKILLYSYLRQKNNFPSYKSDKCKFALYSESLCDNNISKEENDHLFKFMKKKKFISNRKFFTKECYFTGNYKNCKDFKYQELDEEMKNYKFNVYYDCDVGFDFKWQKPLIIEEGDEDIETDDEMIKRGMFKVKRDLDEALEEFTDNKYSCTNLRRYKVKFLKKK